MTKPVLKAKKAVAFVGGTGAPSAISLTSGWSTSHGDGNANFAPIADDFVIARYHTASTADRSIGITTSGYTEHYEGYANGSTLDTNYSVNSKKMGGTPDTTIQPSATGNNADAGSVMIEVWRGVDPTTPLDVAIQALTGTGTGEPDPPSATPVTLDAVASFGAGGTGSGSPFTDPGGISAFHTIASADSNSGQVMSAYIEWAGSGAINPPVIPGHNGNGQSWGADTLVLRPAVPGGDGTDEVTISNVDNPSPAVGAVTIIQHHVTAVSNVAVGSPVVGTVTIGQKHAIAPAGIETGSPVIDAINVDQVHWLSIAHVNVGSPRAEPLLGPELVNNGTFQTGTQGWSTVNSTLQQVDAGGGNFKLRVRNTTEPYGRAIQTVNTIIGARYRFVYTSMAGDSAPQTTLDDGTDFYLQDVSAGTDEEFEFVAKTTTTNITLWVNHTGENAYSDFDNISLKRTAELVLNGTFDLDVGQWTALEGVTISHVSGKMRITRTGGGENEIVQQIIPTVPGENYLVHIDVFVTDIFLNVGGIESGVYSPGSVDLSFVATGPTTAINVHPWGVGNPEVDNISIKPAGPSADQFQILTITTFSVGSPEVSAVTVGVIHSVSISHVAVGSPDVGAVTVNNFPPGDAVTISDVAIGSPVVDAIAVTQRQSLSISGVSVAGPTAGPPTIVQRHILGIASVAIGTPVVDAISIGQRHVTSINDAVNPAPIAPAPAVGVVHVVTIPHAAAGVPEYTSVTVDQLLSAGALSLSESIDAEPEDLILDADVEHAHISADVERLVLSWR